MTARTLEIVLPLPPRQMHPNARTHWKAKLKPKCEQRQEALQAAKAAMDGGTFRWDRAEVQFTWYLANRNDPDNLLAWLKATIDGLQDAGVVANDSAFIYHPPIQFCGKEAKGERKVVLRITEAPRAD